MVELQKGGLKARFARNAADVTAAQALRFQSFRTGDAVQTLDQDKFDAAAQHVLIENIENGRLVCCYRVLFLNDGWEIDQCYSAQYYDLTSFRKFDFPMVEMGRFCIDAEFQGADVLRLAWGFLTRFVREHNVEMLFGCSSFHGVEPEEFQDTFAYLGANFLAPKAWRPAVKAAKVHCFSELKPANGPDFRRALKGMPTLLRTYLAMGGRVSDHAVIDAELNTLHVFTGLIVKGIPAARVKILEGMSM
ncbi:MAG: putative hemolysin [Candidatus Paceibacteria bacterium]|jgi:putative hemolysin